MGARCIFSRGQCHIPVPWRRAGRDTDTVQDGGNDWKRPSWDAREGVGYTAHRPSSTTGSTEYISRFGKEVEQVVNCFTCSTFYLPLTKSIPLSSPPLQQQCYVHLNNGEKKWRQIVPCYISFCFRLIWFGFCIYLVAIAFCFRSKQSWSQLINILCMRTGCLITQPSHVACSILFAQYTRSGTLRGEVK